MPLLVRWPKVIKAGSVNTDIVLNLDFAATFLDFAGTAVPADIQGRTVPEGQLPEGLAMVSFASAPFSELNLDYRAEPRVIDLPPYNGRKVAVIEGAAGEWLELIEAN